MKLGNHIRRCRFDKDETPQQELANAQNTLQQLQDILDHCIPSAYSGRHGHSGVYLHRPVESAHGPSDLHPESRAQHHRAGAEQIRGHRQHRSSIGAPADQPAPGRVTAVDDTPYPYLRSGAEAFSQRTGYQLRSQRINQQERRLSRETSNGNRRTIGGDRGSAGSHSRTGRDFRAFEAFRCERGNGDGGLQGHDLQHA